MSLDELFCGIKAIGRFPEESCEALQTKGNMQQQNMKSGDVGVGNVGIRGL